MDRESYSPTLFSPVWCCHRNQSRVEISIRRPIPADICGKTPLLQSWSEALILGIGSDLKHNDAWKCEICCMSCNLRLQVFAFHSNSRFSETCSRNKLQRHVLDTPSSTSDRALRQLNVCVFLIFSDVYPQIHHLCEAGKNPCNLAIIEQAKMTAAMLPGSGIQPPGLLDKPVGVEYPLSASCCGCQKDSTGDPAAQMSRCSGCKLTRWVLTLAPEYEMGVLMSSS